MPKRKYHPTAPEDPFASPHDLGMGAWARERHGVFSESLILARGWLIERARVRRLQSELDALESEVDELRQELEHQRAEAWEAMSDAQREAAIKGACA